MLIHNKNEEVEHAMMTLEWLRRNVPIFDEHIDTYLKTSGPILEVEQKAAHGGGSAPSSSGGSSTPSPSLGIGSLRGNK